MAEDSKELLQMIKQLMEENNKLKQQQLAQAEAQRGDVPNYQSEVVTNPRGNPAHQKTLVNTFETMLSLGKKDPQMTLGEKQAFEFERTRNLDEAMDIVARLLVRAKKRDITLKFPDVDLGDDD